MATTEKSLKAQLLVSHAEHVGVCFITPIYILLQLKWCGARKREVCLFGTCKVLCIPQRIIYLIVASKRLIF